MLSRLLQQSKLGKEDYQLGHQHYNEQQYSTAEQFFRHPVQEKEKVLREKPIDTLRSKYLPAIELFERYKDHEAEQLLRTLVQEQEKAFGKEDFDTLQSKYWLALTLYRQQKYPEAEQLLRQSVKEHQKVFGKEHSKTLESKQWLAITLLKQQKCPEAELLLRQSVKGREKVHGKEYSETLKSKYWLANTLLEQEKYTEAEQLLRQLVKDQEKVLGKEHSHTLGSKYWLAATLYKGQNYTAAEQLLRQSVKEREKILGSAHQDTIESKDALLKVVLARTSSASLHTITEKAVLSRLSDFFAKNKEDSAQYTDPQIGHISSLLSQLNPQWSKIPRTYIVLRTIGCLKLLDDFIDLGFSDHWFLITEQSLPHCLRPSQRSDFVEAQNLVITKSMDLERGKEGRHCYFRRDEPLPFKIQGILGSGGFGQVDKVLSSISFREYARKQVPRSKVFGGRATEGIKQFVSEIEILKRLEHRHVVEFVGSYTDAGYMGLIMSPVADMDLSTYLAQAGTDKYGELRTFFGCLARALEYLHENSVRHKDIKPGNILIRSGNVLFTDFGLAFDFTDAGGSTTVSMVNGMTPRYCAPEVAAYESRNTASDIWSLGIVFLDMFFVLKGKTVQYMHDFFEAHGSRMKFVRTNRDALLELTEELKETGRMSDNRVLEWVQQMLEPDPRLRPAAAVLMASIVAAGKRDSDSGPFCGICCISDDDEFFDAIDEFEDDAAC